ncbi:MAG TPA: alpha/beta hydrolase [Polyangiaceae bacterium]|nr:alpha/beta hydrolase [Polyangiaceae bacterium]
MSVEHRRVSAGRLELHVAELGSGPPVLLLHGFPAYWADWQGQMQALAAAGFRAIAPDLPGYGESDRLPHVLDYRLKLLAADIAGLISALGFSKVHVVGHDWGGPLAYCLASRHPELVDRLVVINAPHPAQLRSALRHFDQLRRSWYALMFQLPWFPEWLVCQWLPMWLSMRGLTVRPGAFSEADVQRYLAAMRRPGVARAALSYYRAQFRAPVGPPWFVTQRTLLLWGERDLALSARVLLPDLARHVPDVRVARFANAGHWLHHDLPELVNQHLIDFLSPE